MSWYENQQKGLGREYLVSVTDCLKLLEINPFAYASIHLQIRKINTKRLPYSLYYIIENKEVTVFALTHSSH